MCDDLGNRMKAHYDNRSRCYLPRRTYTLLRVDGRSFHNYTRGLERPFDTSLTGDPTKAVIAPFIIGIEVLPWFHEINSGSATAGSFQADAFTTDGVTDLDSYSIDTSQGGTLPNISVISSWSPDQLSPRSRG